MTGPQLEDGFLRVANELAEAFAAAGLTKRQYSVIWAVLRQTYGYNRKSDTISMWWIAKMTGLKRSHVSETVNELVERHVLIRAAGESRHGQQVANLGINKNHNEWTVPKTDPVQNSTGPKTGTVTVPKTGRDRPQNGKHTKDTKDRKTVIAKTLAPDSFPVTEEMAEYASKQGITDQHTLADQTERFLLHHRAKGSKFSNWYAAWQTWIRNFVNPPWGGGKPRGHLRCDKSWMEDR